MRRAVLVVEDDERIRDSVVIVLDRAGYEVLTAASVVAARQVIFARPDADNLCLVVDVVLENENGIAFAQELLARHPGFRVLLISGYTDEVLLGQPAESRHVEFLPKPFSRHDLLAAMRRLDD